MRHTFTPGMPCPKNCGRILHTREDLYRRLVLCRPCGLEYFRQKNQSYIGAAVGAGKEMPRKAGRAAYQTLRDELAAEAGFGIPYRPQRQYPQVEAVRYG